MLTVWTPLTRCTHTHEDVCFAELAACVQGRPRISTHPDLACFFWKGVCCSHSTCVAMQVAGRGEGLWCRATGGAHFFFGVSKTNLLVVLSSARPCCWCCSTAVPTPHPLFFYLRPGACRVAHPAAAATASESFVYALAFAKRPATAAVSWFTGNIRRAYATFLLENARVCAVARCFLSSVLDDMVMIWYWKCAAARNSKLVEY